jgi:nucleotide-binding universal stress UspA family protein
MARSALGSVADQLIRRGTVPVLLVRPIVEEARCADLTRAVVPLDGSAVAEAALDVALALAGSIVEHITLLHVIDSRAPQDNQALSEQKTAAQRYLDGVVARLATESLPGPCTFRAELASGDVAQAIVARAKQEHAMVVMATHGESGARLWFFGSVADHVLHNADAPVLLVYPFGCLQHQDSVHRFANHADVAGDASHACDPTAG